MIHELGCINLEDRRRDIQLTMLYKIINRIANVPNKDIVIAADSRTRSKHGHKLFIMSNNTNQCNYSFFPQTISQWNCLPKH